MKIIVSSKLGTTYPRNKDLRTKTPFCSQNISLSELFIPFVNPQANDQSLSSRKPTCSFCTNQLWNILLQCMLVINTSLLIHCIICLRNLAVHQQSFKLTHETDANIPGRNKVYHEEIRRSIITKTVEICLRGKMTRAHLSKLREYGAE